MKYACIAGERGTLSVERALELLKVSVSGYYAWHKQQPTQRLDSPNDSALVAQIGQIFVDSRATSGSPRVTAALRQQGIVCNRKRVAGLMRLHGLVAKYRRRRRGTTTDSGHALPIAPNRLKRAFSAQRPHQKWVVDITYIATREGWLYLALVLDVFSRKIIGWAMDTHRKTSLVECALQMALDQRQPARGQLLHHSDRGSQYASHTYQQRLTDWNVTVSMSRAADPYDNALMESFIGTLKTECADHIFVSRQAARSQLFAYLEGWYNRRRLLSALGYLSPEQFELQVLSDNDSLHSQG